MADQKHISKDALLSLMTTGYAAFDALLKGLDQEGMLTTPGVNGSWSIKDNIAHLTWWQQRVLTTLQEVRDSGGEEPVDPMDGLSEDEINERIYQENKDRPLEAVWNDFRAVSPALVEHIATLTEEQINSPLTSKRKYPLFGWILCNTFGHYHEHTHIILGWLNQ